MVRARGLGVLASATLLPFAFACGSTGGGGTTASTCKPDSVASVPSTASLTYAAAASALQAAPHQATGTVLKIGFIGILSGQYTSYGVDEQRGAQLALDAANAAGVTVNGTIHAAAGLSRRRGRRHQGRTGRHQAGRRQGGGGDRRHLLNRDDCRVEDLLRQRHHSDLTLGHQPDKYTAQGFKTAFRVVGHDNQQGPADADFMVKTLGCKNVGVMDDKSTYGQGLADNVAKQIPVDGGIIVDREHVDATQSDFSAQLTTMKGHNPDVIFYGGYSPQSGPLVQQARRLGIKATFVSGDGSQDPESIKLAGSDAEGLFASNAGPAPSLQPGYAAFQTAYKTKYNADIFQYAPQAFDATNIIINAIKKAGADKAAILAAVAATEQLPGCRAELHVHQHW